MCDLGYIKIPIKKYIDEYEFNQGVPITNYPENSAFWSLIITQAVIEICIAFGKIRLQQKISPPSLGLIKREPSIIVPREWKTHKTLIDNVSVSLETFWYCYKNLWNILLEQDIYEPEITDPIATSNPALACSALVQLAVYDSGCNPDDIKRLTREYYKDINKLTEKIMKKAVTLGLYIPCRFAKEMRKLGLEYTYPGCP